MTRKSYLSIILIVTLVGRVLTDSCIYDNVSVGPGLKAFTMINESVVPIIGNISHLKLEKVYYECEDKNNLLIGHQYRQCLNDYLAGQVPRWGAAHFIESHFIECSFHRMSISSNMT